MRRYKDHRPLRGWMGNRNHFECKEERKRDEGRERVSLHLMWGLSKASWGSKATMADLMLRPLVNLQALFFSLLLEEAFILLLCFPFSTHTFNLVTYVLFHAMKRSFTSRTPYYFLLNKRCFYLCESYIHLCLMLNVFQLKTISKVIYAQRSLAPTV